MAVKRGGLGKGLANLIPEAEKDNVSQIVGDGTTLMVSIDEVEPNPNQPRTNFDEDKLSELVDSISQHGMVNPIIVRQKNGYYEIVGGERRWRAAKLAGLNEVQILVKDLTDREVDELALIDNLQREDLNPIEEALAYKKLIDNYGLKQDEVADRVSKSRAEVSNTMRLLNLEERVQKMLVDGMISQSHARAILGLPEGEDQVKFAERIFDEKMSVRDVEKAVKKLTQEKKETTEIDKKLNQIKIVYAEVEEKLKSILGTKVRINAKDENKGVIEIEYYSCDQMNELIEKLEA